MDSVHAEIGRCEDGGELVDPREYVSGLVHEPGYLGRAANGHLVMRAIRHGAAGPWVPELELPSYMGVARAGRPLA